MPLRSVFRRCIRTAATIALIGGSISCSGGATSPSATPTPTPTPAATLAGTWSGLTFQGRSISFSVSQSNQLTALSLGYEIDACRGVASFSNLAIPLFGVAGTGATAFAYGTTLPDRSEVGISVQGYSMPGDAIWGGVIIYGLPSCGTSESVAGTFQAARR